MTFVQDFRFGENFCGEITQFLDPNVYEAAAKRILWKSRIPHFILVHDLYGNEI